MVANFKNKPEQTGAAEPAPAKRKTITYGSVTIECDPPDEEQIRKNILDGQRAFARAIEWAFNHKPGVDIEFEKDVPYYHADPEHPSFYIRTLNGKQERGYYSKEKNGFVVCE